jgi:hypothetical protein
MRLESTSGSLFEMKIMGYARSGDNWLIIWVHVRNGRADWTASGEVLEVRDVKKLAKWLEKVGKGRVKRGSVEFLEPNLSFFVEKTDTTGGELRVHLDSEFAYDWPDADDDEGYRVRFPLSELSLSEAAEELRTELQNCQSSARR